MATQNARELGCFFLLKFVLAFVIPCTLILRGTVFSSASTAAQWLTLAATSVAIYLICLWCDAMAARFVSVRRQRGLRVYLSSVMALDFVASLGAANLLAALLLKLAERLN